MADTVKVGPWDALDGQARDVNIGSRRQRLKTITISWGWDFENARIIGISFVYVDQEDQPVLVGPWGKIDPQLSQTIEMTQEDQLNCVSGTLDDSAGITSLQLIINQQSYAFGSPAGPAFSAPLPQGDGDVVAFFGRSDDTLKALGVYVLEKNGLPVMIGPWGGSGGAPVNITTPVQLKSVTVYSAQSINGFSFTYVDQNGDSIATDTWGTTTGGKQTFDLNQGEYVDNIFASFDDDNGVNSLRFTTNKKNVHGPYGRLSGTVFSVPLPDKAVVGNHNGAVVGFFGRSGGDGLVALGVYVGLAPNPEP
uniref:Jacalin-type lectin domain-containing protein n=1 Tax=Hordeum vulgare subsp. vulgare TaxID=112509 RepID=A0A8I6YTA2_HORVV